MLKFFAEKMWVAFAAFAVQKLLTIFSAKNIRILYIESAKTVNEITLNELVKLTMLWTTGPSSLPIGVSENAGWVANSVGPDQTPMSDPGLHCYTHRKLFVGV